MGIQSSDTKIRIMESTIRMFNRFGPMVPMSKISEDAGVAAGTPFKYFSSKDELLLASYYYARNSVLKTKREDPLSETTAEGIVKAIVRDIIRWSVLCPEEHQYVEKYEDAVCYNYFSDDFRKLYEGVVDELDIWQRIKHDVRKDIPKEVISRIISVHCSVFCRYIRHCGLRLDEPETDALIEASADSIWNSIRKI